MFDRIALRSLFWALLALSSALTVLASAGWLTRPSFVAVAPYLSALSLLVAVTGWRLLHRELLRRMQQDAVLEPRMRRLQDAMQASVDGMFLLRTVRDSSGEIRDFEITDANARGAAMLYRLPTQVTGVRLRRDLDGLGRALFQQYLEAVTFRTAVAEESRVHRRHLNASWVRHQASPTSDGLAVTLQDISRQKREELRLRKASLTDDLTGLHNRRGFMALAEQQLRLARRHAKDSVVLYVDMNGFKDLNDTFGHAVGDRALVEVARLLRRTVRDCDVVARLGGDEFTVLALDADGHGARVMQKRIEDQLASLNARRLLPTPLALTIGCTRVRSTDPANIGELLARADQLLYARKRRRALAAAAATAKPARAPRRTPRTLPTVPIPPDVAAVAMAAARSLPSPVAVAANATTSAAVPATALPLALPMERGVTSPA
ncbi:GGDEF domain-containing protein [Gemmatimonas sp.]|jgi:diguanylate cyclase (GGDEF)-like protein|uniref:GGDEF domain-containing protein n=1 Tax=Gemmatimonas sp. TaxID=1962908 RepID=UPI0022C2B641|nr:GGDEF domain-containing protein [Gemmatimonas sp.]MCZ8204826.1 GGDEF domain-containing protein [Gemmatimonas sp.]